MCTSKKFLAVKIRLLLLPPLSFFTLLPYSLLLYDNLDGRLQNADKNYGTLTSCHGIDLLPLFTENS